MTRFNSTSLRSAPGWSYLAAAAFSVICWLVAFMWVMAVVS